MTDSAAGRVRAFLDARPDRDDHESSDIILTEVDPDPARGRWLHLTRADLRALLDERDEDARAVDALIMASVRGGIGDEFHRAFFELRRRFIVRIAELDARDAARTASGTDTHTRKDGHG
jgi:hypothetical protein